MSESDVDDFDLGWVIDEYGVRYGYCNSCGEEAAEFADCCDDGEVVPYDVTQSERLP